MIEVALTKPRILPPKGLLIAVCAQIPLLIASPGVRPTILEIVVGAGLLLAGAVLNIWSERLFRRDQVGVCPFTHVPVLIAHGPYRITRNPMYLGLICLNLGVTLLSGVLANVWSSIAFAIWLHYAYVIPEEAFLRHEVGPAFDGYVDHVPRWVMVM
jgi:protein-S-isoprenylcysteine O-methyltransferase Ste14